MEYKMIVRQTLFSFSPAGRGRLKLRSVRFLPEHLMKKKDNLLLVKKQNGVEFFIGGETPLARLSREQFSFVTAATRFFGLMPGQKEMPIWLWADSLQMDRESDSGPVTADFVPVTC